MDGQMSLFDGFLTEYCDTKPEVGRELVFYHEGKSYPCVVNAHCGADFFHVKFTGKRPRAEWEGFHLRVAGYGESWGYAEKTEKPISVEIRGICDDAFCPKCGRAFWDHEADTERCPDCGCLLNWERWHRLNDD